MADVVRMRYPWSAHFLEHGSTTLKKITSQTTATSSQKVLDLINRLLRARAQEVVSINIGDPIPLDGEAQIPLAIANPTQVVDALGTYLGPLNPLQMLGPQQESCSTSTVSPIMGMLNNSVKYKTDKERQEETEVFNALPCFKKSLVTPGLGLGKSGPTPHKFYTTIPIEKKELKK